jgi:transketolase
MSVTSAAGVSTSTIEAIKEKARRLSVLSMMATTAAGSGHPTSCMSAAELVAGTFFYAMKLDPKNPNSPTSDRFVLSKGHAAPVLYAALAEAGVFPESRLMTLRQFSSELEGHPTPRIPGVDAATGSLGQGLSVGAGLAIGARMDKTGVRVYVLVGDGEMAEGQIWEALQIASHYRLDNLVAILDVNRLGQQGETMLGWDLKTYQKRVEVFGWKTIIVEDGHDLKQVSEAFKKIHCTMPVMIIAKTIKGKGVPAVENKEGWHGKIIPNEMVGLNEINKKLESYL